MSVVKDMSKVHSSLLVPESEREDAQGPKQDKKKKPFARTHKRTQYNHRFVIAVAGFGNRYGHEQI